MNPRSTRTSLLSLLGAAAAAWIVLGAADQPGSADTAAAQDWADCLTCHPDQAITRPALSLLRPRHSGPLRVEDCLGCHQRQAITGMPSGFAHPVRAVAQHIPCTSCHLALPHSAAAPPPVPYGEYEVNGCFECHDGIKARMVLSHRHDSNAQVSCARCHPPHGDSRAALPQSLWPAELMGEWAGGGAGHPANRACLECHPEPTLFGRRSGGFVTLNTVNYHERHVLAGQCLCIECHEPHGSVLPAMLRTALPSGEALILRQLGHGANCTVICHGVEHLEWGYINQVR